MIFESKLLKEIRGIKHGFGTKSEPVPEFISNLWENTKPIWRQVHGTNIVEVATVKQNCGEVDGLCCRTHGIPIGIQTADCVPILLAKRTGDFVAGVHAGWRGTKAKILSSLWSFLKKEFKEDPSDWVAAIGPSIGPCCYEVDAKLAEDFKKDFNLKLQRPRYLDLQEINALQLREIGISDFDIIRTCTKCSVIDSEHVFRSYRREGGGTRQFSVISIESEVH